MADFDEDDKNNSADDTTIQPLAEDNDTPAANPDDQAATLPIDHPSTDSNLDSQEAYDEGLDGAAEAEDPAGRSDDDSGREPEHVA
jgi:hypothetical protein